MLFRPPSPCHLRVTHIQQQNNGECLAACALMVCNYLGVRVSHRQVTRALGIRRGLGPPFSQIQHLHTLGVTVIYQEFGTLQEIYNLLCHGWPCIVGVQTQELPHWNKVNTQHAVVVVGMDQAHVYLNDPEFPAAPIQTPLGDFDLAWLAQDEVYAVLTR